MTRRRRIFTLTTFITGKLLWTFHVIPHPGEFGYDTWPPDAWKTIGGVHNWNEMTIDEKRGIAYIPLGTSRFDFYGANRRATICSGIRFSPWTCAPARGCGITSWCTTTCGITICRSRRSFSP